jgi:hydroxypyruvate reductase
MKIDPQLLLRRMFDAAVARAMPDKCLPPFLPSLPKGRTIVVGAGKAAATMAKAVEQNWQGELSGLVVTRYGHRTPTKRIEVVEAAHPVPDLAGREAAERILKLVQDSARMISCCASSRAAVPPASARQVSPTRTSKPSIAFIQSGANIAEMNCVRKHHRRSRRPPLPPVISKVVTLTISDVPGDDPAVIASGPTVPDRTTFADALAILEKYRITSQRASWRTCVPRARNAQPAIRVWPASRRIWSQRLSNPSGCRKHRARGRRHTSDLGDSLEGEARSGGRACRHRPAICGMGSRPLRRASCCPAARPRSR